MYVTYVITNINKTIMYITVKQQSLLQVKYKIVAKKNFKILGKPVGMRKNLSKEVYNTYKRKCNN